MIDLMREKTTDWQGIFLKHNTDKNIDNLVHTITADRDCSDAYKADLRSWFELLVQTSK